MCVDYSTGDFTALHETMDKAYAGGANGSADPEEQEQGGGAGTDKAQMAGATLYAADDFETLGTYLGYEGEALENFVASIERYNELCEKGVDEDFGKDPSLLFPLKNPPYYGYCGTKAIGVLMVTVGGLLIDENGAVLGRDYRPIKGLYAAGNASGGPLWLAVLHEHRWRESLDGRDPGYDHRHLRGKSVGLQGQKGLG